MSHETELQEYIMELELVKNHLREASAMLEQFSRRSVMRFDPAQPQKISKVINSDSVNRKARDCIALALFTLKQEVVELYWKKEMGDEYKY